MSGRMAAPPKGRALLKALVPLMFLAWCQMTAAMPPLSDVEEGVPMTMEMHEPRQDVPVEDFSGGFSKDFSVNLPTNEFLGNFQDVPAAKEQSMGFIIGKPSSFPVFSALGGFGPMADQHSGKEDDSFVPAFEPPVVVEISDIAEEQPQFQPQQFTQQNQETPPLKKANVLYRRKRKAGEPDVTEDSSLIPHKRVHRVQKDGDIPHSRNPREDKVIQDNEASFSDHPFDFQTFPGFHFPVFQSERIKPSSNPGRSYTSAPRPRGGISRKVEIRTPDDDFIVPESQRFYPNFNPRFPPTPPVPSQQPFFPSPPPAPRSPATRGARFNGHGPGFRESANTRNNGGFRDFHDAFYGPGAREAINRPDFVFPSSRQPFHREKEPLDNSLLGSGNFEVLKGGTFFDEDDPDAYDAYDHLLHDGHFGKHGPRGNHHQSNNHVDDFFSNFRDFSEFAARRSDEGETNYDDPTYYSHAFASEHIPQIIDSSHPEFPVDIANKTLLQEGKKENRNVSIKESNPKDIKDSTAKSTSKPSIKDIKHKKHRKPKNIQEVMEDLEAQSDDKDSLSTDEKDPMMAMF